MLYNIYDIDQTIVGVYRTLGSGWKCVQGVEMVSISETQDDAVIKEIVKYGKFK